MREAGSCYGRLMERLWDELEVACRLAKGAGALIGEIYQSDFPVEHKPGDDGPVTEADRRANEHIVAGLRAAFPDDGIVAEESDDHGTGLSARRCWFVDPLDGTREFVARNGEFVVQIGLAIDGEACLGVVLQPTGDQLWTGIVGAGCWLETESVVIGVQLPRTVPRRPRFLGSRSRPSSLVRQVAERVGGARVDPCGSVGLKAGRIVDGQADAYVHFGATTSLWDVCAPEAVVRAAGGRFCGLDGMPLHYDRGGTRNTAGILACHPLLFSRLRGAIDHVLAEPSTGRTPEPGAS
jgi:3'(2'), 5'-bisphosphate nucleotidase